MNCIVDIQNEGNRVLAYLPFDPRVEFNIPKGTIYVRCAIENVEFKSRLMSRGGGKFCIIFNKQLLKDLGIDGEEKLNVHLDIEPDARPPIPEPDQAPEMLNNEVLEAISNRTSIRAFTNEDVVKVQIDTILNAGLCAPSATNKRPFHFLVTKDKEKMARIAENNRYVGMLKSAAACIVVCGDRVVQGIPEWILADCSAATENILLAIHSIGLGGVWCGVKQSGDLYKAIVKEFNLPNHIRPVSLVAFGHPASKKTQTNRYEPAKIHYKSW